MKKKVLRDIDCIIDDTTNIIEELLKRIQV